MTAEVALHPLLEAFKERMRIFHDGEDANLSRMLESSDEAVERLVGESDSSDPQVRELILERARYVYNDQVEFFYENFKADILALALGNMEMEDRDD
ncbi:putative phage protein [Streptococcus oralis]|uniref:Putative phage protein n=1 Tax=Streptococcus oralis TaxID=1303 RepID=A0A139RIM4_STROR|nr:phage gp6-like head-tail connector protein [Streptococcus oralis]KXU14602.1 putative phage protein [Streptococcus oralis]